MTRVKELRRIERAIENKDVADLEWAASYCRMRIDLAEMKQHEKTWSQILRRVEAARSST
jgi:hypothetical protein